MTNKRKRPPTTEEIVTDLLKPKDPKFPVITDEDGNVIWGNHRIEAVRKSAS